MAKNKKEIIEKAKETLKPIEMNNELYEFMKTIQRRPKAERDDFLKTISNSYEKGGVIALNRAFVDGLLTKKEFKNHWKGELGIMESDMQPILQAYYNRKDKEFSIKEEVAVVTTKGTCIDKHRKEIFKKFKVKVYNVNEMLDMFKKEHPEKYAELQKKFKQEIEEEKYLDSYIN